ncbi:HdeD family acid-resistance protein [Glycomyces harbinensis]|nr:HdeD family acid-resistance protein [Glycomyces harbinensis]
MLELLARNWAWVLVRGIFTIVFGALAVFWPEITLLAMVILFGAYAIVDGVTAIAMGLRRSSGRGFLIFMGALGVVAGLVALFWPGITALALLYIIAFWAIVIGVGSIVSGFGLSRDAGGRWLFILSGLAGIVLGVLLLAKPGDGAVALVVTIGFFAIIWGFITVFTSVRLRRLAKELDVG